jgi:bifunctional DNA-binding transcriptional regulator/antitoxin component of YhaV-PrlF toxin-antitoxin module
MFNSHSHHVQTAEWESLSLSELDEKGRLTVPKDFRRSLGIERKVLLIDAGDHLKIIPVAKDPIAALRGAFKTKKSFRQLRRQAEAELDREARGE